MFLSQKIPTLTPVMISSLDGPSEFIWGCPQYAYKLFFRSLVPVKLILGLP